MAASLRKEGGSGPVPTYVMAAKRDVLVNEAVDVPSHHQHTSHLTRRTAFLTSPLSSKPGVTITSSKHKFYYAFISQPMIVDDPDSETVSVLGPNDHFPRLYDAERCKGTFPT
ncbi:hypothetical protein GMOD_00005327 [Pyrenophora seminiperda CCB06]|uniref:Uncharacterized protein n=1 Tax=Pyrenophora seminiperda CCB06 TaxID=1302712 RepID=A0A3M7LVI3_9PLEO|nr:hypothetical protein GMOD_00005327 [Pyrenophora seminiperda CCB06]